VIIGACGLWPLACGPWFVVVVVVVVIIIVVVVVVVVVVAVIVGIVTRFDYNILIMVYGIVYFAYQYPVCIIQIKAGEYKEFNAQCTVPGYIHDTRARQQPREHGQRTVAQQASLELGAWGDVYTYILYTCTCT
jgi:hypothetical protein